MRDVLSLPLLVINEMPDNLKSAQMCLVNTILPETLPHAQQPTPKSCSLCQKHHGCQSSDSLHSISTTGARGVVKVRAPWSPQPHSSPTTSKQRVPPPSAWPSALSQGNALGSHPSLRALHSVAFRCLSDASPSPALGRNMTTLE